MTYDIITIGGAIRDFTFYVEKFKGKTAGKVCFPLGTKINIKEAYFTHGGGACNVAVGLANFGLKVATIVRVGKDYSGRVIIDGLKKKKVETKFIQIDQKLHTGVSAIIQPKGGERTIFTFRGANDNLQSSIFNFQFPITKWIYIASLSGKWEELLNKIFDPKSKNSNLKIAWNPGILQIQAGKIGLAKFLKRTDLLILNKTESALLTDKSEKNVPQLLKSLIQLGPKIVVITCGPKGAYVMAENEILYQPAK
ncbi:MAG: carbohydrate kinase family protein, partial [Patescibacteria group bacterium]|nr:carbohydrate kinase family protein [Patescibacteria group bacterium]